ncbi:MAG TPA: glycosyl hydrolase-related protein, partial [Roseiflexaceae bacterium]|nr:glycosyl hydrolase-related protein [Roseiflexaceae bacterium]
SLLPHTGSWGQATIAAAYALNDPLLAADLTPATGDSQSQTVPAASFVAVEQPNIVIETVKQAEDGHGIIVRGYESQRRRGPATLRTGFASGAAWRCNLLEEQTSALEVSDGAVHFNVRPYEIFTLRIVPA